MKLNSKNIIFFFLVVLIGSFPASSQSQPIFNKINQSNGLSNGRVSSIIKETNGFVWIGTNNGLNRYDGHNIKVYNKQNSSLNANDISDLFLDSKSRIWIGTLGGGLNLYNALEDTFTAYKSSINSPESIASNEINTIFEDSKGNLWIGTKNGLSVFKENQNTFTSYAHQSNNSQTINHNDVRSIYEDINGNLWIGTYGGGLNKFAPEKGVFEYIKPSNNISSDFIHSIGSLNNHKILIGTNGEGLLIFDLNTLEFEKKELKAKERINIVRCVKKAKDGTIWIGTDGNGLFKLENSAQVHNYTYNSQLESSISSNAIYDLMEDGDANIWIGTAWNGVNILNENNDYTFLSSTLRGETPSPVLSIYKDEDQCFLGLDGKGLSILQDDKASIKRYSKDNKKSIGGDYIQFIKKGSDQTFWIGTFVNGLINFNPKTEAFTQYKHETGNTKSLSYNDVRYVIEDDTNNLWIATWGGGLNYLNTKTKEFNSFQKQEEDSLSLSSNNIISIQKEGDSLWLATFGGGVNLFNTKTKQTKQFRYSENNPNSISSDYINTILKDSKENLWIGTSGEGLNLYNEKTGQINRFEKKENIRYQTITSIIEDNDGQIWFSTKQGIFNYNYDTNSFKSFSKLFGEYHINAAFKDEKGLLYFGGSKGLVRFNPKTILTKNINPKVKLTNFKLFNKEVPIGENEVLKKNITLAESLTLKHNLDVITFEFAAMAFPFSANCDYAIKLENFDKDWRTIGKDKTVTYTNLAPGDYIFKVKSKTSGSDWGEEATSIKVDILKPFWLEWWAFLIYGLFILFAFYLFRKYIIAWEKMKSNLELERLTHEKDIELYNLKQQFFTNISHEIRTPVTLILGSINRLLQINTFKEEKQLNPVNTLTKNAKHLLNLVNELLDFRKLEHNKIQLKVTKEDWVQFCEETYLSFSEIAKQKHIDFSFNSSNLQTPLWFDKNQMDKVLYNLLSNAFKFTGKGGAINLTLSETEKNATLILKDEGIGISKKQLSKIFNRFYQTETINSFKATGFGLGLSISKEIIALHHGDIQVESKKGLGTTFTIVLKKGKNHFKESELGGHESDAERIENYLVDKQKETKNLPSNTDIVKEQTLLIVEDNKDIRAYIIELLSDEYNILEANNGKEGLEIARTHLPDLMISDIMMPVMNGIELTQELKTNILTSHIPIVLLTARASLINQMEGFNTGADEYVTKPFNELLLRTRIKNLIKNRTLLHKRFLSEDIMPISELAKNKTDQEFLQKLGQLIEKHIDSDALKADFVSQELGMSHSVIYKKLKSLTNLSLIEYVRDYKLKTAKQLLIQKGYTVADACYYVGYSDRKYFSKLFKQRFGKTPSSFLQKQ
ncbi:hybrid sensor histidine kinase/response regulator transcription factor [Flavivirga spongiicola]|uniref:histidine kinase n=1 Tax=Flavivirga spongiicola TaxID=421621 RepID=A0ABU7XZD7_9FLAO|nr:two-component regulator propeller domain-containing protein [Flavivirga sp. MEBiC05379]MDO5980805.1 two-component regulator propeller domain-containing protein [Flavivirga sp. MEBiC05379]